ncbi:hypothetical protein A0H81_02784 [Grifola frondosa]|uniref:Uncharacterized protein n=1 Tax=Grifola frondosa TaxID=5627 RepID=A0A1C7MLB5_GRIFR|nr:hypothetical protein A0H81_02784 [Grifola frondosa]
MPSIGDEADNPFIDFEPIDKNRSTNTPLVESPTNLEREDTNPVPPSLSFEEWMGGIKEGATGPGVPGGDPPRRTPTRTNTADEETPSSYGLTTDLLPPLPPTFEEWVGGIEAGRKGTVEPGTTGTNLLGGVTFHRPRRPGGPNGPGGPSRVEAQQMLAGPSRTGGPTRWDTPITEPLPYPAPTNAFHGLLVGVEALIDSGANHNLLSQRLVEQHRVPTRTLPVPIKIGHAHGPSNQRGYIPNKSKDIFSFRERSSPPGSTSMI